jgi:murein DD-endopeptidase MepM/ murein hydrolase activator NlpD
MTIGGDRFGSNAGAGTTWPSGTSPGELPVLTPSQQDLVDAYMDPGQRSTMDNNQRAQAERLLGDLVYGRAIVNEEAAPFSNDYYVQEGFGQLSGTRDLGPGGSPVTAPGATPTAGQVPPSQPAHIPESMTDAEQNHIDAVIQVAKLETSDDHPNLRQLREMIQAKVETEGDDAEIGGVSLTDIDQAEDILDNYREHRVGLRRGELAHETEDYMRAMFSFAYGETDPTSGQLLAKYDWDAKVEQSKMDGSYGPVEPTSVAPPNVSTTRGGGKINPVSLAVMKRAIGGVDPVTGKAYQMTDDDRDVIADSIGAMDPTEWLTTTYVPRSVPLPGRNSRRDLRETQQMGMNGYDAYLEGALLNYLTSFQGQPGEVGELARDQLGAFQATMTADVATQIQSVLADPGVALSPASRQMLQTFLTQPQEGWFGPEGQIRLQAMLPTQPTSGIVLSAAEEAQVAQEAEASGIDPFVAKEQYIANKANQLGIPLIEGVTPDLLAQTSSILADPWRAQDWFNKMEARAQQPLAETTGIAGGSTQQGVWDMNDPAQRAVAIAHYLNSDPEGMSVVLADVSSYHYAGLAPGDTRALQDTRSFAQRTGRGATLPGGERYTYGMDTGMIPGATSMDMPGVKWGGSRSAIFDRKYAVDEREFMVAVNRMGSENTHTVDQMIRDAAENDLDWKTLFTFFDYTTNGFKGNNNIPGTAISTTASQLGQLQAQYGSEFLALVALQFGPAIADATRDNMLNSEWIMRISQFAGELQAKASGDGTEADGMRLNSRLAFEIDSVGGLSAFTLDPATVKEKATAYYKDLLFADPTEGEIAQIQAAVAGAAASKARSSSPYGQTMGKASSGTAQVNSEGWIQPITGGHYESSWGDPRSGGTRSHHGIDVGAANGTPILAPRTGVVQSANRSSSLGGWQLYIVDEEGFRHYFAHMQSDSPLQAGTKVFAGQVVGYVGETGNAAGPHLHYGLYDPSGNITDPYPYLAGATKTYSQAGDFPKAVGKGATAPGADIMTDPQTVALQAFRDLPAYKEMFANLPAGMSDEVLVQGISSLLASWTGGEVIGAAPEAVRTGVKAASSEALWGQLIGDDAAWRESPTLRSRISRIAGVFDSLES